MRVTIYLVLIFAWMALGSKVTNVKTVFACQTPCNCRAIYKPVCGKSGKTHANACFATCFKDIVVKSGECKTCVNEKPVKKTKCSWQKYGENGKRKHCCSWLQSGSRKTQRKCQYVGEPHYTINKVECQNKKIDGGVREECCTWIRKIVGKKTTDSKKECSFKGPLITKKLVKGCRWVNLGKDKRRLQCCSHKNVCKHKKGDKKCTKSGRECKWSGPVIRLEVVTKCAYGKPVNGVSHKECCAVTVECKKFKGVKKEQCKAVTKRCKKTKDSIKSTKHKSCQWRTFGKNGKRQRCCEWTHHCKSGEKCLVQDKKCYWNGCAKYSELKGKCQWRDRTKHIKQRLCCQYLRTCQCGKCVNSSQKCHWRGHKITNIGHQDCQWKVVGSNGKRKECCSHKKACIGNKCTQSKECKWVSELHTNREFSKCHWQHISKSTKRRECCTYQEKCVGKSCENKKLKCRLAGSVVVEKPGKNCQLKTISKDGCKRLECCSYKRKCIASGKGKPVCKDVEKKCEFTGEKKWFIKRKSVVWEKFGKNAERQRECTWEDYCVGDKKKCTPTKKVCKFIGLIRQYHTHNICEFKKKGKDSQQRHCCTIVKKCECKKLGDLNNCIISKKNCEWVGNVITTSHNSKCFKVAIGKNSSRNKCCTHTKTCEGNNVNCKTKVHSCNYVGPTHTFKQFTECKYVPFAEGKRKHCCIKLKSCLIHHEKVADKKPQEQCSVKDQKCYYTGPSIRTRKSKVCSFKQLGGYKQRYCCNRKTTHHDKKLEKVVDSGCYFTGTKIPIPQKFYKKRHTKKDEKYQTVYCTKIFECTRTGSVNGDCKFVRDENCKVVHKTFVTHKLKCENKSYKSKGRNCTRKKCTKQTFHQLGNQKPQCNQVTTYWDGKEECKDSVVVQKKCRVETFNKGCRQERCCETKHVNGELASNLCELVGKRVCPLVTKCHNERFKREVDKRTAIFTRRKCCQGEKCWYVAVARADPHFDTLRGGRHVSEPYTGTFRYFYNGDCIVQFQMNKSGSDSVITGVATKCKGVSNNFLLTTNFPSPVPKFKEYGNVGSKIGEYKFAKQVGERVVNKNGKDEKVFVNFGLYVVKLDGANLEVVRDETTNTLTLNIAVDVDTNLDDASGLIVGNAIHKVPAKSLLVKRENSLFETYVEYNELTPRPDPSLEKFAKSSCYGVKNSQKAECIHDVLVTKLDWGALYQVENLALGELHN